MDVESAETIHSLELAKAVERYFGCTSDKLQELGSLFLVEGADGAPKPLNLG